MAGNESLVDESRVNSQGALSHWAVPLVLVWAWRLACKDPLDPLPPPQPVGITCAQKSLASGTGRQGALVASGLS